MTLQERIAKARDIMGAPGHQAKNGVEVWHLNKDAGDDAWVTLGHVPKEQFLSAYRETVETEPGYSDTFDPNQFDVQAVTHKMATLDPKDEWYLNWGSNKGPLPITLLQSW